MNTLYNAITCGIQIDGAGVMFNWDSDSPNDVLQLAVDTSGEFDARDVRIIYGYEYSPSASATDKKILRNYLKSLSGSPELYDENIDDFVDCAVLRLDQRCPLRLFGATVHTQSGDGQASLIDVMRSHLWSYMNNDDLDFELVKQAYKHVQFNSELAEQALRDAGYNEKYIQREIQFTLKKFEELKRSEELFKMKRFMPKEIRSGFTHFLSFQNDEERQAYEALQGTDVLVFDDFLTSGQTIKEIIRCLKAIHDDNTLTAFVLVKQ